MAYDGDYLNICMAQAFNFSLTEAVTVSGDKWNPCGHMLLHVGGPAGYYFHVAGLRSQPKYMNATGFVRYLKETGKKTLSRRKVEIKHPEKAQAKLDELLSKPWTWLVLPNNCSNFVEEVVRAGGSTAGLWFNCPAKEAFR